MSDLQFPPMFQGEGLTGPADPFDRALALAITGTDAGEAINALAGDDIAPGGILTQRKL